MIWLGLLLGFAIGFGCRWFDIPLPAPPNIVGALLVVAMTLGFLAADTQNREPSSSHQKIQPTLHQTIQDLNHS